VATAVGASVITVLLVLTPLRFSYRSPELRILIETAEAVIAGLVALLLYGRHRRSGLRGDLLAAYAFFVFAAANLFFALLPALGTPTPGGTLDRFGTWAPLAARTVGAAALAAAALAPRRWTRVSRPGLVMAAALAATVVTVAAAVMAMLDWLPPVLEERFPPSGSQLPDLDAPAALLVAQLVLLAVFAVAAAGFGRQARREANPLLTALACGCVLAAFARLNFFLYPSLYTDVVHVGDLLRLLFFLVLLVGAAAEIAGYWRTEAEAAATRERHRLARQLHDGLAQELSFIRSHTQAMARGASHPGVIPLIAEAAERAMAESRQVVDALRAEEPAPLERLLRDAAGEVAGPGGIGVEVSVDARVRVPAAAQSEVGQLVHQATASAVRLRAATTVSVRLEPRDSRTVLCVEDDGTGVAPDRTDEVARRDLERPAAALGATCRAGPGHRGGTRVEIILPWKPARAGGRGARAP